MGADLVPAEPPMVQVDLSLYADYSGHYLMPDGSVTIIRQEGNRLVSQMIKYPRLELLPLSETVFYPQGIWGVTGTFHRDSKGRVRRMVIRIEDQVVPAEKFEPIVLTPDQLVEYTGDYYSDEVGTMYTLVVENGLLVAQHRRHSDTPLIPTLVDQFAGFERGFACVRFTRDGEGKVNGFSVTEERVRNLPFYKLDLDNIASVRQARQ
jgi:hypothetical protein